jgi:hypothetical protein
LWCVHSDRTRHSRKLTVDSCLLHSLSDAYLYKDSWFGNGNGESFDLKPRCTGKESNMLFCSLGYTFGRRECSHSEDLGVKCVATPIGNHV